MPLESQPLSGAELPTRVEKLNHLVTFEPEDGEPFEVNLDALELRLDSTRGEGKYIPLTTDTAKDKSYLHIGIFSSDQKIGMIGVSLNPNGHAVVIDSQLVDAHANAGKGIGKQAYTNLARYLKEEYGLTLDSNKFMQPAAEHMWKSLESAGQARLIREWNEDRQQYDQHYEFIV